MKVRRKSKIQDGKYNEFDKFNRKHNLIYKGSSEIKEELSDHVDLILYDKNGKIIPQHKLGLKMDVKI